MKKAAALLVVITVILATASAVWYYRIGPGSGTAEPRMSEQIILRIGALTIAADLADSPELREQGLGGRSVLDEGSGMWFVFPKDGYWQFWMKDTLIPLDILWVDESGTIVTIAHNVLPETFPDTFTSTKPARYVLEVPGGYAQKYKVSEGSKITW